MEYLGVDFGGREIWGMENGMTSGHNHLGTVVGLSDGAGLHVASVDTDAFGNPLASAATGVWATSLAERGLTTKELDGTSGMYYFYQRWYDPQTATFASRAPYPPMMEHPYGYGMNNPVMFVDPDGESWVDWLINNSPNGRITREFGFDAIEGGADGDPCKVDKYKDGRNVIAGALGVSAAAAGVAGAGIAGVSVQVKLGAGLTGKFLVRMDDVGGFGIRRDPEHHKKKHGHWHCWWWREDKR